MLIERTHAGLSSLQSVLIPLDISVGQITLPHRKRLDLQLFIAVYGIECILDLVTTLTNQPQLTLTNRFLSPGRCCRSEGSDEEGEQSNEGDQDWEVVPQHLCR